MIIKTHIIKLFNIFYIILLVNIMFFTLPKMFSIGIYMPILFLIALFLIHIYSDTLKNKFNIIVLLSCIISFSFMIYIATNNVYVPLKGDYEAIYTAIKELNETGHFTASLEYYLLHPHQLFTTVFYSVVNRIFILFGSSTAVSPLFTSYLNSFLTITGIFLATQATKKLFSEKFAFLTLFMLLSHISYYTANVLIYTHVLSVFALGIFLYLFALSETVKKHNLTIYALVGVSLAVATSIEGIFNISIIAIIIYIFLKYNINEAAKKILVVLIIFSFSIGLINAIYTKTNIFNSTNRHNESIPYYHWLMMGFSEEGMFNDEDYEMTASLDTTSERSIAAKQILIERIWSRSPSEMYKFVMSKQTIAWGGASYGAYITPHTSTLFSTFRFMLIIGLFLSIILNYKNKEITAIKFFEIWVVGIILFICIWEVAYIYLYSSTLMLIIPATNGYLSVFNSLKNKSKSDNAFAFLLSYIFFKINCHFIY